MIFTYHEVVPTTSPYVYSISKGVLAGHLAYLAAIEPTRDHSSGPLVTFDDGHESQHRYGLAALEAAGIKATFFVTAGWTATRPAYMSWQQLRELIATGHRVQSHGWSHKLLTACSDRELEYEIRQSRAILEDRLTVRIDSISMPGGRVNRRVLRACAAAGYTQVYTSNPWRTPANRAGVYHIGRLMVRNSDTSRRLAALLRAEQRPFASARLIHAGKTLTRSILGDSLYHHLWSLVGKKAFCEEINRQYMAKC